MVPKGGILGELFVCGCRQLPVKEKVGRRAVDGGEEGLDVVWSQGCWVTLGCDGEIGVLWQTRGRREKTDLMRILWSSSSIKVSFAEQIHADSAAPPCSCLRRGLPLKKRSYSIFFIFVVHFESVSCHQCFCYMLINAGPWKLHFYTSNNAEPPMCYCHQEHAWYSSIYITTYGKASPNIPVFGSV